MRARSREDRRCDGRRGSRSREDRRCDGLRRARSGEDRRCDGLRRARSREDRRCDGRKGARSREDRLCDGRKGARSREDRRRDGFIPNSGDSARLGLPTDADRCGANSSDTLGIPPRPRLPLDALGDGRRRSESPPFGISPPPALQAVPLARNARSSVVRPGRPAYRLQVSDAMRDWFNSALSANSARSKARLHGPLGSDRGPPGEARRTPIGRSRGDEIDGGDVDRIGRPTRSKAGSWR
jgi:hypothetical protein